jgi:superfamily II DNA or RNA helicase
LVAKRILDEGIDLPSVRTAVLLASSTSQREWIQRRGRVLRQDPTDPAKRATIYDIPSLTTAADLSDEVHERIVRTECERLSTFNNDAANSADNNNRIAEIRATYLGHR